MVCDVGLGINRRQGGSARWARWNDTWGGLDEWDATLSDLDQAMCMGVEVFVKKLIGVKGEKNRVG